jgi:D-alanine-D-alanine ligase
MNWQEKRVAIVCGGRSSERAVSLRTGAAFERALVAEGITPLVFDLVEGAIGALVAARPDVVLIALHGADGEDGRLQGCLDLFGIAYTGSGCAASALAMDKVRSKCVFERMGVPTPAWAIAERRGDGGVPGAPLGLPFVVKPALEGSSVGVSVVRDIAQWPDAWATAAACRGDVLVEQFVPGRELTVGVMDGQCMGVVEIAAADGFYDYQAKYERRDTSYLYPAPLDDATRARVVAAALAAFRALGCAGVARVDIMLDGDEPFVLEVNTVPGMTETSLVPKIAAGNGVPFPQFVLSMLEHAVAASRER